ncbi:hypothetical protein ACA910_009020 [Epithemia clementina (nom. ined.)]
MAQRGASAGLSMAGKGFFGSLCAGTFGLGVWQTQRYFEKMELVAQREQALVQPPLSISEFLLAVAATTTTTTTTTSMDKSTSSTTTIDPNNNNNNNHNHHNNNHRPWQFRRVQCTGHFDYASECLVGPRGPPPGALPNKPGYAAGGMSRAPLGYYVLTPLVVPLLPPQPQSQSQPQPQQQAVVWINRGWIPRYLVYSNDKQKQQQQQQRREPQQQQQQQQQQQSSPSSSSSSLVPTWDRHTGPVSITCVPSSNLEQPRYMVPDHNFNKHPPELFWMDMNTLYQFYDQQNNQQQQQQQQQNDTTTTTTNNNKNNNITPDKNRNNHDDDDDAVVVGVVCPNMILTMVQDHNNDNDNDKNDPPQKKEEIIMSFPLCPPASSVGEFKTSPAIHAGYAATWYGLAAAGLYMTRILILRK